MNSSVLPKELPMRILEELFKDPSILCKILTEKFKETKKHEIVSVSKVVWVFFLTSGNFANESRIFQQFQPEFRLKSS